MAYKMALLRKKPTDLCLTIPQRGSSAMNPISASSPPPQPATPCPSSNPNIPPIPRLTSSYIPFSVYADEAQSQQSTPPVRPPLPVVARRPLTAAKADLDTAIAKLLGTIAAQHNANRSRRLMLDSKSLFFNDFFHDGKSLAGTGYISGAGSEFVVIPPQPAGYVAPTEIYAHYNLADKQPPPKPVLHDATKPWEFVPSVVCIEEKDDKGAHRGSGNCSTAVGRKGAAALEGVRHAKRKRKSSGLEKGQNDPGKSEEPVAKRRTIE